MSASKTAGSWSLNGGLFQDERMARAGLRHGVTSSVLGDMKRSEVRQQVLRRAGVEVPCRLPRQVHGTGILELDGAVSVEDGQEGDGWLLRAGGCAAGVFVADCVPLFLWHPSGAAAGVFHAGWRGMAAGMPRRAVEAFTRRGFDARELLASLGPRIGPCCFRVGPEVAGRFRLSSLRLGQDGARVDLAAEARAQLAEAGLSPDSVEASPACTSCRKEDLFSYRRDKQDMRMMAFLMLEAG